MEKYINAILLIITNVLLIAANFIYMKNSNMSKRHIKIFKVIIGVCVINIICQLALIVVMKFL